MPLQIETLSPRTLKEWIKDKRELAILDVREEGAFARKHLLLAANLPSWRLELTVGKLVPRRSARIVLVDLDQTLVERAAQKLDAIGYSNVHVLEGGTLAWEAAGYEVFSGVNLVSKAFGEVIEVQRDTPRLDVADVQARLQRGDDVVIVDGRTPEEYRNFSIPGAHSVPNAELLLRIGEIAPRPQTLVIVNCAGRTRSILGAQTLINAGIPNRVAALKDGTMAWLEAGYALANGAVPALPEPAQAVREAAQRLASGVADRSALRYLSDHELQAFEAEAKAGERTLYEFDVRTREEYEAGHLPGWRWAPGGQLVQATDEYAGVRGARIVLADWDGVRAVTTASWLAQLGLHEIFLYKPQAAQLELGPEPRGLWLSQPLTERALSPRQLADLRAQDGVVVYDVDSSLAYARRHIEGAYFAAPDRLPEFVSQLPARTPVVITSSNGVLARLAATELESQHGVAARYLQGGNQAWFAQDLPTATGRDGILTGEDDDWYSPYAYPTQEERRQKMKEYLAWEVALAHQIERDGDVRVRLI